MSESMLSVAYSHHTSGRLEEAVSGYKAVLAEHPDSFDAWHMLGVASHQLGDTDFASSCIRKALELAPHSVDAWFNLGILSSPKSKQQALECFRQVIRLQPAHCRALQQLGALLRGMGQFEEAERQYRAAVEACPGEPMVLVGLGNVLLDLGRKDEALSCQRQALAIAPDCVDAHCQLAELKRFSCGDADLMVMEELARKPLPVDADIALSFARAKAWEDCGDFERSFAALARGNRLKRQTFEYHSAADAVDFEQIKRVFNQEFLRQVAGGGVPTDAPIFIVGMPRSGTTLVEQILSSHPLVHGAGELDTLRQVARAEGLRLRRDGEPTVFGLSRMDAAGASKLAEAYLANVPVAMADLHHFTDKMPLNFKLIGLIKAILPNARIIHCKRDPVDTCVSSYKRLYGAGHPWAYDLEELGHYYVLYRDLMSYWETLLPGSLYTVEYEALVANPEPVVRSLLEYCGLRWDAACLRFHENRRAVRTSSRAQVRQPLYGDAVQRWRRYAPHLTPLLAILGVEAV